ncbi:MAG: FkbM family methyltransferase [Oscillospiraceae bacterium]|jgi:FkbM family methyltransferase|nr:FkbM family methyltransferase [Oscillospiraceae bacterium]
MNRIKKALKRRFSRDYYKDLYRAFQVGKYDDLFIKVLTSWKYYLLFSFFLGGAISWRYIQKVYITLCNIYTSNQNSELFNFNGILLSKPKTKQEISVFIIEVRDFFIYYLTEDMHLCDVITNEGPYEYKNVQLFMNDVVIDCGANMGIFSAIASRKGATVYAFEPNRLVIDNYLKSTAELNPNIHICEYALSHKNDNARFINSQSISMGRFEELKSDSNKKDDDNIIVQTITLDSFVHENNLPRVDFIKADIEGAERYMLMGAKQVLKDFAPKIAICTYHLPDDPKVLRELILDANPKYVIEEKWKKMYAHVPK